MMTGMRKIGATIDYFLGRTGGSKNTPTDNQPESEAKMILTLRRVLGPGVLLNFFIFGSCRIMAKFSTSSPELIPESGDVLLDSTGNIMCGQRSP